MADMSLKRIKAGDEGNVPFVLPAKTVDQKPGFEHEIAEHEVETGKDQRLLPTLEKDIPQESLAVQIQKRQKGESYRTVIDWTMASNHSVRNCFDL